MILNLTWKGIGENFIAKPSGLDYNLGKEPYPGWGVDMDFTKDKRPGSGSFLAGGAWEGGRMGGSFCGVAVYVAFP